MRRALCRGSLCGLLAGATVGTLVTPVGGTVFGGVIGAVIGVIVGFANALALVAFVPVPARPWVARTVASVTSAASGTALAILICGVADGSSRLIVVAFAAVCAAIGAAVGPSVAFGPARRDAPGTCRLRTRTVQ